MAQSELDKLLKAFEDKNTSMEYYILMSVDGIPFKSNIEKNSEVVRIAGLIFDLILYSKKILEDLKEAINDGFLVPYRLREMFDNFGTYEYCEDDDVDGDIDKEKVYTNKKKKTLFLK